MSKSPDAFRTISEVADWLGIQAHVLRFWESKFTQVKPVKRAGGRRYYRPNDMLLLGGIKQLLHEDGLTIKGVQKILREEGMSHVAALSQPLDELTQSEIGTVDEIEETPFIDVPEEPRPQSGVILSFDARAPATDTPPESETAKEAGKAAEASTDAPPDTETAVKEAIANAEPARSDPVAAPEAKTEEPRPPKIEAETEPTAIPEATAADTGPKPTAKPEAPQTDDTRADAAASPQPAEPETAPETAAPEKASDDAAPEPAEPPLQADVARSGDPAPTDVPSPAEDAADARPQAAALPAFLRRPMQAPATDNPPPAEPAAEPARPEPTNEAAEREETDSRPAEAAPRPRDIGMPPLTPLDQIDTAPGVLTAALRCRRLAPDQATEIAPLLQKLSILRDSMAARPRPQTAPDASR